MGETENKPTVLEVTIDESVTNAGQAVNHQVVVSVDHEETKTLQSYSSILTTIHAGYFRITISLAAQALLWKILRLSGASDDQSQAYIHQMFQTLPSMSFLLLWCLAFLTLVLLSFLYVLRCFFHFDMVRAEFWHRIKANYLYAPWISWLLLLQSAPVIDPLFYQVLWWVFIVPILVLDLKIYGQWFTTEKRFLSMVANPTSQISVIGNLSGALAAAQMGWKESAVFMYSLGMAHYFVLFVTLYQRLAGGGRFPAMMRPTFFLFTAAPSLASLTWTSISGTFDTASKMLLSFSVSFHVPGKAGRPALFKKSMRRFNIVWWAYSYPLTLVALASSEYAKKETGGIASALMLVLSMLSILVFLGLVMLTAFNTNNILAKNHSASDFY